jgi:hypothetical protein
MHVREKILLPKPGNAFVDYSLYDFREPSDHERSEGITAVNCYRMKKVGNLSFVDVARHLLELLGKDGVIVDDKTSINFNSTDGEYLGKIEKKSPGSLKDAIRENEEKREYSGSGILLKLRAISEEKMTEGLNKIGRGYFIKDYINLSTAGTTTIVTRERIKE